MILNTAVKEALIETGKEISKRLGYDGKLQKRISEKQGKDFNWE